MNGKNGFLLIELVGGLSLLLFLFFIIFHYIIQLKSLQQSCLKKMHAFSIARNYAEKLYATRSISNSSIDSLKDLFSISLLQKKGQYSFIGSVNKNNDSITFYSICVSWKDNGKDTTYILPMYNIQKLDS